MLEKQARQELLLPIEDGDDELSEDEGFYFPLDYRLRTWSAYRNFGVLPEAGGINDQNPRWWDDMDRMNRRYAIILRNLQLEADAAKEVQGLIGSGSGPPIERLLNG